MNITVKKECKCKNSIPLRILKMKNLTDELGFPMPSFPESMTVVCQICKTQMPVVELSSNAKITGTVVSPIVII